MKNTFDVIVIGVGSMGSAAAYYLSLGGQQVLALEQYDIPHDMGSHAGQSRIVRQTYFEHPDYVPLLLRAYDNWHDLERRIDQQLLFQTGVLYCGRPDGVVIKGNLEAARLHNLPYEELSRKELNRRYPKVCLPDDFAAYFEPVAGFVTPERAVAAYAEQAIALGAVLQAREAVLSWELTGHGVKVVTNKGVYEAGKLIFTAGAWSQSLLKDKSPALRVSRQALGWVSPRDHTAFSMDNFPCWLIEDPDKGIFYGFPILPTARFGGPVGFKVGHHFPGPTIDPSAARLPVDAQEEETFRYGLAKYLPEANGPALSLKTCLYTYSADDHFVIDHLPETKDRVVIACGFSGHGFKFVSVVGEILADMAIRGHTDLPAGFLGLKRLSAS